jgi:hypothetical protein
MADDNFKLTSTDWGKMGKDALWFFLVPLTFYITAVLGVIGEQGHILTLKDFIPTNSTLIVVVSWALNQLLNLIRKYVA